MTSISNFGQTGPYRDYKAQDILIYAMGGPMHQTGVAEREPIKMAGNLMQYHGGTMAATATLVGVCGAQLQGIGQHIDVSLFETHAGTVDRRSTFLDGLCLCRRNHPSPGLSDRRGCCRAAFIPVRMATSVSM